MTKEQSIDNYVTDVINKSVKLTVCDNQLKMGKV